MDFNKGLNDTLSHLDATRKQMEEAKAQMEETLKALQKKQKDFDNGKSKTKEGKKITIFTGGKVVVEFDNHSDAETFFETL